ncbi:MAG: sugar transferase [Actinomycetia bacterium]|nr:sugar transferase [Actinomycetes bacterium]MCP4085380.1 sugar transferase [Actinomycetes bacterium]
MAVIDRGREVVEASVPASTLAVGADGALGAPNASSFRSPLRFNAKTGLVIGDLVAVGVGQALTLALIPEVRTTEFLILAALALPVGGAFLARRRVYNSRFITRRMDEFRRLIEATIRIIVAVAMLALVAGLDLPRSWIIVNFLATSAALLLDREFARRTFSRMRRHGRMRRRVVIVGNNTEGQALEEMLAQDLDLGYEVVAFVDDVTRGVEDCNDELVSAFVADTKAAVRALDASGVIIAATAMEIGSSNRLIRELTDAGIHVELSSTLCDIAAERLTVRPLGRFPVVYVEPVARHGWRQLAKRTFDLLISSVALVLLAPVLAAVAAVVRLDSKGPVLFRQQRVGRNGGLFDVLKFRTMVPDAEDLLTDLADQNEADGPLFKMKDDPRITRIGGFLRRTSLDELPQFWNVIRNEMSLVGPRPAMPDEVEHWSPELHGRLRVKPGITGMWQVSGRSESSFAEYVRLDLYYVDNWSLLVDTAILLKTIPAVAFSRGAY